MNWLLDTCVVSEFVKPRPDAGVVSFVRGCDEATTFLSALTLGEIQKGISMLPSSKRRAELEKWLEKDLRVRFADRVLDVSDEVALRWGTLQGDAIRRGNPLPVVDSLLAATALVHDLTVVTRDDGDIGRAGARVHDPWQPRP